MSESRPALHMAGIENYNVMLYTSVLPSEAVELAHLSDIHHGSVLGGIIAVQHTDKPGKVHRNSDGSYLGGFGCEYAGNGSVEERKLTYAKRCSSSLSGVQG